MPLLILHHTLLGELMTGTAQTGKGRYLGPWRGGEEGSACCCSCWHWARVAALSAFWQAASELRGRSSASAAEEGGLVHRGKGGLTQNRVLP